MITVSYIPMVSTPLCVLVKLSIAQLMKVNIDELSKIMMAIWGLAIPVKTHDTVWMGAV